MKLYCFECQENLTIHADGSIACGCSLQHPNEPVPAGWLDEAQNPVHPETLADWRDFEALGS